MEELDIIPTRPCCTIPDATLLPEEEAVRLAGVLKALGHPVRLQIMHILSQVQGRVCVCEIEAAFQIKQPTVSHHLRTLREAGLIDAEQRGLYLYYRITPDALRYLTTLLRRLTG